MEITPRDLIASLKLGAEELRHSAIGHAAAAQLIWVAEHLENEAAEREQLQAQAEQAAATWRLTLANGDRLSLE